MEKLSFKKWKFIDLFAGLGGFHEALSNLGMQCVFASEIDKQLQDLYEINHGLRPHGDIRAVDEKRDIPKHDVLCAGFPCQPFSLAGRKKGAKCPSSGKLIDDVIRIAKHHKPRYVFLENVPNILTIDEGKFWKYITQSFSKIGYQIEYKIYSPIDFNIPQKRKRVFVIASLKSNDFDWPMPLEKNQDSNALLSYIQNEINSPECRRALEPEKKSALKNWQKIINKIPELKHPIITLAEFGANYPIDGMDKMTLKEIRRYKGAWGQSLENCKTWADVFEKLPHYVKVETKKPSEWLLEGIKYSREIYDINPSFFDEASQPMSSLPRSWQKLQWQGDRKKRSINKHLIQFRASGIRIIKPIYAPSLVAMTPTQTPIIGETGMYINARQAASLQGLEKLKKLPDTPSNAFHALGNAVNAIIVGEIAKATMSN